MLRKKFKGSGPFASPRNKYGAKKTTIDNIVFDSMKEARRYEQLKILQNAGKISELELQPSYAIVLNDHKVCVVKLDFEYLDHATGQYITEDAKGLDTPVSKLKRKLVMAVHGVDVRLV